MVCVVGSRPVQEDDVARLEQVKVEETSVVVEPPEDVGAPEPAPSHCASLNGIDARPLPVKLNLRVQPLWVDVALPAVREERFDVQAVEERPPVRVVHAAVLKPQTNGHPAPVWHLGVPCPRCLTRKARGHEHAVEARAVVLADVVPPVAVSCLEGLYQVVGHC